jgi:hypothetical protein
MGWTGGYTGHRKRVFTKEEGAVVRKFAGHIRGNLVGYLALFVALGGTAVAATSLPANSVGTKQLKNGAVTGAKVAKNTLTGANINESTLGTVPNTTKLGGLSASAYQRRIGTACSGGQAMTAVDATGSPTCQSFGQGTVTSIGAGMGLTNSGTSSDPVLNVDSSVFQKRPISGCSSGSALTALGSDGSVTCQSFGSVNSIAAGTGLTNSGTAAAPVLNVDSSAVQSRVSGTCGDGSAIASIASDGSATCHTLSSVTQFMGGTGSATISTGSGTNAFLFPEGLTPSPSATYGDDATVTSEVSMTAGNLYVSIGTPPGNGITYTFQFRINNSAQGGFECQITGSATSCSDHDTTKTIPAEAMLALEVTATGGTPPPTTVSYGWTGTT